MSFDGSEGSTVSLTDAGNWTENYRDDNPGAVKAHFIGKDLVRDIITQAGCKGIRVYHAVDDAGLTELIFVGAKSNEDDMIETGDVIADRSVPCPNNCGAANDLNGN